MINLVLNLSDGLNPTPLDEIKYKMFKFPGGEIHIVLEELQPNIDGVFITCRINSSDDLMKVIIAHSALKESGVRIINLYMPYIPYARQDRVETHGEPFSLKAFANIINSIGFNRVFVVDPHSLVAPALIDNCVVFDNTPYVKKACYDIGEYNADILLVSPDSGANKKINKLFDTTKLFSGIVRCDKRRNVVTGELNGFEVLSGDLHERTCLIVDDICDGGGTFVGIAKELFAKGADRVYLFTTHGIFSKGFDELQQYIHRVYTTNSINITENPYVTQFKLTI